MIEKAQEMHESIGEPEDAWANLCPETVVSRDECLMERSTLQNSGEHTTVIPDIENESCGADILYQVQQSYVSNEEMIHIVQTSNETQQKVFYFVRDWCVKKNCE